ncbi:hypothetical protein [Neobacillus bataviensis]|nr:hypothetical protein [Neobacillus bataviensis]
MEKNNYESEEQREEITDPEEILNRVNQTFDKISQDVKNMINENKLS